MAVDTTHHEYDDRQGAWKKMRDVVAGEDTVKNCGSEYLPRLGGQDEDGYRAYKMRASFYNATSRTIDGLSGMVFRKPPQVDVVGPLEDFRDDVTLSDVPLHAFAEQVVEEVLTTARCGGLVDYPRVEDRGLTRAQAERMNLRPFWTLYKAEDILNWRVGLIGNRTQLTQVRLHETVEEPGDDEFTDEHINLSHYRTSADLEHGAHFTALPTPFCFGVAENEVPDQIGPEALWTSTSSEAQAGMLEYTGQGLEALEKRLDVKESQMAALGARMLEAPKKAAEAADTARIHRTGEISVLASTAQAVSAGLTMMLEIARDWYGAAGDVRVTLNTDFLPTPMDPQMLTALFQMVQGGRISQQTFFENLQRGEIIAADKTYEDDEEDRANDALAGLE